MVFPSSQGAFAPAPALPYADQPRLVMTTSGDDRLSFAALDPSLPRLLGRVPVGDDPIDIEAPHDVAVSPSGDELFVVLTNPGPGAAVGPHGGHGSSLLPGTVLALDARSAAKRAEVLIDPNAGEILLDDSGATAYVSHFDLVRLQTQVASGTAEEQGWSSVAIIDTASMTRSLLPVCATSHDLELSGDGRTLYVTCSESDQLALVDLPSRQVQRLYVGDAPGTPLSAVYYPYAAVRSPADDSLWISCNRSGEMRVFDAHTGQMDGSRTVKLSGVPMFGDFLADGTTLVVPHQLDDRVSIIDTTQSREIATITLPPKACLNARNVLIGPDDRTVYLLCEGDHVALAGTLVTIDLASHAVLGFVEVGLFPTAIALAPPTP